jgi:Tfp pilus assembly protein FimT
MEMMVVLAIIALIVGVSVPSTIAGLENIRLAAGARSVAAFMNIAANRAERRQQAVELSISIKENSRNHAIARGRLREEAGSAAGHRGAGRLAGARGAHR